MFFAEPTGQGWLQFSELALALVLSALIGLEREMRQKSAGLRTYTLVGLASALIILISKYGFTDILADGRLRDILIVCTQQDFAVTGMQIERDGESIRDRRGKYSGKGRSRSSDPIL
jgi:hypothetical protein